MIFENRIALITGASKGIGKAIALGLAELNFQTVLMGRDRKALEEVSDKITKHTQVKPKILQFDITDAEAVRNAIKEVVTELGRIDVLVNNAGVYFDGTVDIPDKDFTKMLDTNLISQYRFLKEVVPVMKQQRSGHIFNVASRAGKVGFAGSGAYSASKFGLVGLSESLYRELNPQGIKVTALCPGWVNTKMAYEAGSTLESDQMIQPEDLFRTVKWLLSLSPGACVKEVVIETPYSIS